MKPRWRDRLVALGVLSFFSGLVLTLAVMWDAPGDCAVWSRGVAGTIAGVLLLAPIASPFAYVAGVVVVTCVRVAAGRETL